MSYLHNGLQFKFISRHHSYDVYGRDLLRILVDRKTKKVIVDYIASKNQKKGR